MTYDDAGWHSDTAADLGLGEEASATHIGMFFAWLAVHRQTAPGYTDTAALLARTITPGAFVIERCDGQIDPSMLTDRGQDFTAAIYEAYMEAYEPIAASLGDGESYAAPDGWGTYDAVAPLIDELHARWSAGS
ncbi:MAG: hypothetical protein WAW85_00390 [Gordonia sp. (in: high G+C Gram-positive bacteria)]|uniref:DUF7832 domain-containing protein n=1 Tax=Gordonia sp. (in: high G+C Gram-positive bacteria) TaxID=84139 RepID=UPI003BB62A05